MRSSLLTTLRAPRLARALRHVALLLTLPLLMPAARAGDDDAHDAAPGNGPAGAVVPPSNNIVACFGALTHDPLASCGSGTASVLQSASFGLSVAVAATGSSGAGAGKVAFQVLSITKLLDANTALLLASASAGRALPEVSLAFYDTTGKVVRWFEFRLVLVASVSYSDTVAPGGEAVESVGLQYGAIQSGQ